MKSALINGHPLAAVGATIPAEDLLVRLLSALAKHSPGSYEIDRDAVADALASAIHPAEQRNSQIDSAPTPWLTVAEAAELARCGRKTLYREVRAGRLRAARVGGRRDLRFRAAWVDEWLTRSSQAVDVTPIRA